jgi:hypothetical protein
VQQNTAATTVERTRRKSCHGYCLTGFGTTGQRAIHSTDFETARIGMRKILWPSCVQVAIIVAVEAVDFRTK